jgi:argininosuccinate synthase
MESITLDREQIRIRDGLIPEYATLVYRGFWFSPEREMLQTMIDSTQKVVTGTVRVKLYKGSVTVVGRKSPYTLYREDVVTFERDEVYDQRDATGFIRLTGLRLRLDTLRRLDLRRAHAELLISIEADSRALRALPTPSPDPFPEWEGEPEAAAH